MKTTPAVLLGIYLVILVVGGIGWVSNLVKLAQCDFEAPYKAEAIHAVGIVPIVGAFTGYMDFGK